MRFLCFAILVLCVSDISATPRQSDEDQQPDSIEATRPSNSFYDHIMANLQNSNQLVQLAMKPHGIAPPLADDYDDIPIPQAHYAFVNPALNGEKTPHWTETLENFKNNPSISPDIKDKVLQTVQTPIKIYGAGTESRFPLLVEYFVQRIQNYYSHYVYEDMSRPSSWENKKNVTDKPSSEKEPVTEAAKVEPSSNVSANTAEVEEDIDYIVDITLGPEIDDVPEVVLTDEDFEKTTEEWEAPKKKLNSPESAPTVIVEKETLALKVVEPIEVEADSFLYVGDGNGEELLTRSNKRRKLKKKKRN